jgi:hypothetical protein
MVIVSCEDIFLAMYSKGSNARTIQHLLRNDAFASLLSVVGCQADQIYLQHKLLDNQNHDGMTLR